MSHAPERISVWLLKKGDRGVAAMRTWKKRFFQSFGLKDEVEVCYFKTADGEKQGSIELRTVLEIRLVHEPGVEAELHVLTTHGRTYMLKAARNDDEDELTRVWTQWQQWLVYVRSFGGGPQSRAEIATAAASAVVPTSPGPLRASPRPLVPSLSGLPRSAEKEREASPPPPPATAAGSVASPGPSKKESPRKLERKETLSPRRLLEGAKARALRMRGGTAGSAGGEGDKEEAMAQDGEGVLRFSLVPSMQPSLSLCFAVVSNELRGFEGSELVECLPLASVAAVKRHSSDAKRFRLQMLDGESAFFEADDAATAGKWFAKLSDIAGESEWAEPELGMCELHLDVAEEVDVKVSGPPVPPRPALHVSKSPRVMTAAEESGGGAEKKNLRSETTEVSCVVCGSANPLSALRCGECGSSDGFGENKPFPALPLRMTEAALGSPAVGRPVRGESPVAEKHKRPLPPPPPPQL